MFVASEVTKTAKTALMKIPGAPLTLVVERFDRLVAGGSLRRVHQEDCAQALGLHPDETTIALSPMYDVVPAAEITPLVVDMGMRIDGQIRLDLVGHEQLRNEAVSWGLPSRRVDVLLEDFADMLREGIESASEIYPEAGERHRAAALARLKRASR